MLVNLIILIIGGFAIAIFSTLTGGGASLLLMPLIGYTVGTKSIAPIMTIGISLSSSSRVYYFWEYIDWKLFFWLFPATIIGSVLGALSFASIGSEYLQIIIGLYLISTILQIRLLSLKKNAITIANQNERLIQSSIPKTTIPETTKQEPALKAWHFAPIGFVVSFLSGLIGGVGPLMNSAYLKYGIGKEGLIGTRSANAVLLHITKIISYGSLGFIDLEIVQYGMILGLSSIVGNYWGKKYLIKVSDIIFRYILIISMVVSGILILINNIDFILSLIHNNQKL